MLEDEDADSELWWRTVRELSASGESMVDAVEGANLVLQALARQREALKESGTIKRPERYRGQKAG